MGSKQNMGCGGSKDNSKTAEPTWAPPSSTVVACTKDNEEKHVEEPSAEKVERTVVSSPPQEKQETPDAPIATQQESPKEPQAEGAANVENTPAEEPGTQDPAPEQQGVDIVEEKAVEVAEAPAGESATIPVATDKVAPTTGEIMTVVETLVEPDEPNEEVEKPIVQVAGG